MKKTIKQIIAIVLIFVITTVLLCACVPKVKQINEAKKEEIAYTTFCNEQKEKLNKYLEENPNLSLLSYTFGTDKEECIKLAAACYDKTTNQSSNLIVISDNDSIVRLTIGDGTEEIHYLNEYPIIIYSDKELEFPLYHYDDKEMVFHRIECKFNKETNDTYFKVVVEAKESIKSETTP